MLLLSACSDNQITESTAETLPTSIPTTESTAPSETETTAPTEPPVREDGERLTDQQIQSYQQLFTRQLDSYTIHPYNLYNIAMTIEFASPEEIDLSMFFENGFVDLRQLTEEEQTWLEEQGYSSSRDMYALPASRMNEILTQYFGLTIEETNGVGLNSLPYNAELDRYYTDPGGVRFMANFEITDGYAYENGLVRLYYINNFGDEYVFTMQSNSNEGGYGYRFLSNLPTGN